MPLDFSRRGRRWQEETVRVWGEDPLVGGGKTKGGGGGGEQEKGGGQGVGTRGGRRRRDEKGGRGREGGEGQEGVLQQANSEDSGIDCRFQAARLCGRWHTL